MRLLESRAYWWVNRLSSYLLLSGLWLLCSSLVVTLFPATAAMFAVFRAWQENPDEAFYLPFFTYLRRRFVGDFLLGLLWLSAAGLLGANLLLVPSALPPSLPLVRALAFGCWLLGALVFAAASVFVFPLRACYELGLWASVRTAVALGLARLGTTALCWGVLALSGTLFWYLPASLLLSGAVAGHLVFWLCRRVLRPLET